MRPSLTTTSANVPSYTVQIVKREVEAELTFKDGSGGDSMGYTYADFVLDRSFGAHGQVMARDRRVRADKNAFYIDDLIAGSTAGPLPSLSWYGAPCQRLVILNGRLWYRERDLVGSLVTVLTNASPGKSLRSEGERCQGDSYESCVHV